MKLSPLNRRRFERFKANKRGWWSLWLFIVLFGLSLGAELIANDKPLVVHYDGEWYFPALKRYPETDFGGEFPLEANYKSPYIRELLAKKDALVVWPPIPYSYQSINYDLKVPAPAPPSLENWLGTDDQGRDVLARVIYGFRISVLFALTLTILSSIIGVIAGALQGFYGGWVDLAGQRFLEIWSGLPVLYLLIILASFVQPNFWWLLGIMLLFSWMSLVDVVRAEFLRGRNLEYVRAARALGMQDMATSPLDPPPLPAPAPTVSSFVPPRLNFCSSASTSAGAKILGTGRWVVDDRDRVASSTVREADDESRLRLRIEI